MRWNDPHYPGKWAETAQVEGKKWIGKVCRNRAIQQVISGDHVETIWSSDPYENEQEALEAAKNYIKGGSN